MTSAQTDELKALVSVKELVWHKSHMTPWMDDWHTISPLIYTVRCADENGWKWSCSGAGAHGYAGNPEDAKEDAQAHFNATILSALSPAARAEAGEAVGYTGQYTLDNLARGEPGNIYPSQVGSYVPLFAAPPAVAEQADVERLRAELQEMAWLIESVRACYFIGRPDCQNEFVQSTWRKVKAADDARAARSKEGH